MKKIIKNKVYDTDTAQNIGSWSNEYGRSDFHYVIEELFKKRTGEYFLLGEGGAASKYAVSAGQNSWVGGSQIIPMTYESAQKWAEENLGSDKYIAEFGDPGEGETKLTATISMAAKKTLEVAAQKAGITQTEMLERLITENLA